MPIAKRRKERKKGIANGRENKKIKLAAHGRRRIFAGYLPNRRKHYLWLTFCLCLFASIRVRSRLESLPLPIVTIE